jgi:hypothetical protein
VRDPDAGAGDHERAVTYHPGPSSPPQPCRCWTPPDARRECALRTRAVNYNSQQARGATPFLSAGEIWITAPPLRMGGVSAGLGIPPAAPASPFLALRFAELVLGFRLSTYGLAVSFRGVSELTRG